MLIWELLFENRIEGYELVLSITWMKNFIDKEYHPVIEEYITDYVDDALDNIEKGAFEEMLVHNDDLRELAFSAKEGKKLLQQFDFIEADEGFKNKLLASINY